MRFEYNEETETYIYVGYSHIGVLETFEYEVKMIEISDKAMEEIEYRYLPIEFEDMSERAKTLFTEYLDLD